MGARGHPRFIVYLAVIFYDGGRRGGEGGGESAVLQRASERPTQRVLRRVARTRSVRVYV